MVTVDSVGALACPVCRHKVLLASCDENSPLNHTRWYVLRETTFSSLPRTLPARDRNFSGYTVRVVLVVFYLCQKLNHLAHEK